MNEPEILSLVELLNNRFAKPMAELYTAVQEFVALRQQTSELTATKERLGREVQQLLTQVAAENTRVNEIREQVRAFHTEAKRLQEEEDRIKVQKAQAAGVAEHHYAATIKKLQEQEVEAQKSLAAKRVEVNQVDVSLKELKTQWEATQKRLERDRNEMEALVKAKEVAEGQLRAAREEYQKFIDQLGALK